MYVACYSGYGLSQDNPGNPKQLSRELVCYDLQTGKQLWQTAFATTGAEEPYQGFQALHGFASSTPATDGQAIYAFFGRDGVVAVSLDGKKLWQTSVGTKTHGWGSATSPVLFENLVIVNASVESGELVALDKKSGQKVWQAPGMDQSWSTPALVKTEDGAIELAVSTRNDVLGFDPKTGKQLWSCEAIQDYICPSAIAHEGIVYAIGGRSNTAVAIKAGGRGDVTDTHQLWSIRKGSNVSSPAYHDGHLYWVHETRGTAYCVDAKTGEVAYEQRLEPRPDRFYASPVIADGRIYLVNRNTGTYVLAAQPEFKLIAHNPPLDDSIFNASPAIAEGQLLLRSDKFLYCVASSAGSVAAFP